MKIHENAIESNTSFVVAQNLCQVSNNDNKLGSRSSGLTIVDMTNRLGPLVLDDSNIVILSENPDQTLDLSVHIQTYHAFNGKLAKIVNLREFSSLLLGKRDTSNFIYIIAGSIEDLNATDLVILLKQITNIFIFQLPEFRATGYMTATAGFDDICGALGEDLVLRKHLLSTLTKHEFLAITKEVESVCVLERERRNIFNFKEGSSK